jgi:dienelactone hydrolase
MIRVNPRWPTGDAVAAVLFAASAAGCSAAPADDPTLALSPSAQPELAEDLPSELANMGATADLRCVADLSLPQRVDYAKPGPYDVGTLDTTFEDLSRSIAKSETHEAAASRRLQTMIYYPASGPAPLFGQAAVANARPFPLIMYSHGFSSSRDEAAPIAKLAASHGYIVVAPTFPLSNLLANGGNPDPDDAPNQAGDLSFLIDQLTEASEEPGNLFAGAVDVTRIGATGVSMGGFTTLLATYHPKVKDTRIKASAPIAALSAFFEPGFFHTREVPLLLVHGDIDAFLDYKLNSRRAYELAQPHSRLLTLRNGTHAAFAVQFDPGLTLLLNSLMGMPGSDPTNPDGFGCGGVGANLQEEKPVLSPEMSGPENFVDLAEGAKGIRACVGKEYTKPALDPRLQVDITASAVVSFFQAHLASSADTREDGCRYLLNRVPKNSAALLE